jgi:lipoprotein-anchoring transpeptidase ErfK/SrfK
MFVRRFFVLLYLSAALTRSPGARAAEIVISIKKQTMTVLEGRTRKAEFPVSTSKFGLGDSFRSFRTPTGTFAVERKVGDRLPAGAVLKGLHFTGEVLAADAPGRDTIVTRVLCLRGLDGSNRNAAARGIYIHGTPEEKKIGQPASYGCIRMRSRDVIALYDTVPVGTRVMITDGPPSGAADKPDLHGDDWFR